MTACFIIVATNHGRRLNEIIGSRQLPYGLYFGCINESKDSPEIKLIDIYIEKTLQDWGSFNVNKLVVDAVKCLEDLSQFFRPLSTDSKQYQPTLDLRRKDKLFSYRLFTEDGFKGKPFSYSYQAASSIFLKRAGIKNMELDHRGHPFRRFFALLYYNRYDMPDLMAISNHLCHLDPGTTHIYLEDPVMRIAAEKIEELFGSRILEDAKQMDSEMEDVRSEMFASTVLEILKGERSGGTWPQVVLRVYKIMSESVEFKELDLNHKSYAISGALMDENYIRWPFPHGGCNVGGNQISLAEAPCRRKDENHPHMEDASPELCSKCSHFDCSLLNIQFLTDSSEMHRRVEEDYSKPTFLRIANKKARESLDRVIKTELALIKENKMMIHSLVGDFATQIAPLSMQVVS